jgi:TRAP-type uncharacterized transport system substrate-binding protein
VKKILHILKATGLALALTALVPASAHAQDDTVTIAAGKEGGGYDSFAKRLATRMAQRGLNATVANMNGSDEITLALCNGSAQIGLTQIDAVYQRAIEGCTLDPLALYGNEYAMIFFPPDSRYNELSDLGPDNAVLVDTIGSGTELFWKTIVGIEQGEDGNKSEWSKATPVHDLLAMSNTLAEFGDIDAVIMVRTLKSDDVIRMLDLGWKMGELWDKDINDQMFQNTALYEAEKIEIRSGGVKQVDWAYEVRSFLMASASWRRSNPETFRTIQMSMN